MVIIILLVTNVWPVPVATGFETCICGCSFDGIVGSNLVEGTDVRLLWMLCVVRQRSLRWADLLSREVLGCLCVCVCVHTRLCVWWGVLEFDQVQQKPSTTKTNRQKEVTIRKDVWINGVCEGHFVIWGVTLVPWFCHYLLAFNILVFVCIWSKIYFNRANVTCRWIGDTILC